MEQWTPVRLTQNGKEVAAFGDFYPVQFKGRKDYTENEWFIVTSQYSIRECFHPDFNCAFIRKDGKGNEIRDTRTYDAVKRRFEELKIEEILGKLSLLDIQDKIIKKSKETPPPKFKEEEINEILNDEIPNP